MKHFARKAYRHSIYLLRFICWLFSEIESHLSEPGDPLYLRKLLLRSYGIVPPKSIWIGRNFLLVNNNKGLALGDNCALGDNVTISNHSRITIGDGFIGATGLHIDSGSHDLETLQPVYSQITIGDNVWCGIQTTILSGSVIGNNCVIAAGSVVRSQIVPNSMAAGVPASVKKLLSRGIDLKLWSWH